MGLMDVLNGMQNGPRGPRAPIDWQHRRRHVADDDGDARPACLQSAEKFHEWPERGTGRSGSLRLRAPAADLEAGWAVLPAVLAMFSKAADWADCWPAAPREAFSRGGLNDLLKQLQQSGQGQAAQSWVGNGPNQEISSDDLAKALGADQINTLMSHTGLSREDLLAGLSQHLPEVVDQLTPDGRVPTEQELSRSL